MIIKMTSDNPSEVLEFVPIPPTRLLETVNEHPRDRHITFQEEGHLYTIEGMEGRPTSVTTLIHHSFPEFNADEVIDKMMRSPRWSKSKYYGMTKQEIKDQWAASALEASTAGTLMHADIEHFLNQEPVLDPDCIEHRYFQTFWKAFCDANPDLIPYRTEWLVYDDDRKISGSIDCVLINKKTGAICILDWKRSKEIKKENKYQKGLPPLAHLEDCNYNHYSLQLNIYRHILETKYQKNVTGMFIVVFHPDNKNFMIHPINKHDIASIWDELTAPHLKH